MHQCLNVIEIFLKMHTSKVVLNKLPPNMPFVFDLDHERDRAIVAITSIQKNSQSIAPTIFSHYFKKQNKGKGK